MTKQNTMLLIGSDIKLNTIYRITDTFAQNKIIKKRYIYIYLHAKQYEMNVIRNRFANLRKFTNLPKQVPKVKKKYSSKIKWSSKCQKKINRIVGRYVKLKQITIK